ncbi:hypothetical protein DEB41_03545 [Vibrio anguillarum]|uniref:Uncharacterized protein n=2 Tax=Vibrio TaxID=662 RepID=A0A191W636_VIBAN|nr:hypothetical protein N175_03935 [Vibrio anguillarum M3]AQM18841.1 hypothetical protein PN51_03275 [Vibrio anguillarum]MDF9389496.1 hypothetical protein [Vibrio sp. 1151_11]MDQ2191975.1 hypothetical protein [Vibrio sp. A14(2019)]MDQ2197719.1 hypothetical protein [Vibrio sp. 2017_1457_11]NAW91595.1 hypothetical protein [Vibrio sp. V24_P1S3T111]NAW98031.1 hypothetical protein [Vibrio sp. V23_P3S9T160]NAX19258.1 hypothetical protein [Vibrio sp. V22_P2S10T140]NAX44630.1 hypothetical protein [
MPPLSKSPKLPLRAFGFSRPLVSQKQACSNGGSQDYREVSRKNHLFLNKITNFLFCFKSVRIELGQMFP